MESEAIATAESTVLAGAYTESDVKKQIQLIQKIMRDSMQENTHYGTIPGTNNKNVLLKAGAEKLAFVFRLYGDSHITQTDLGNGHREYSVRTEIKQIGTDVVVGVGEGSASTMETKYRWRYAKRVCPECKMETIGKSKPEYGGGWYCNQRAGGCGAKFRSEDPAITGQQLGKIENPDIADTYNTALKIAKKRSLIDGILLATAASDIFTQDLDDEDIRGETEEEAKKKATENATAANTEALKAALTNEAQVKVLFDSLGENGYTAEHLKKAMKDRYGKGATKDLTQAEILELRALVLRRDLIQNETQNETKQDASRPSELTPEEKAEYGITEDHDERAAIQGEAGADALTGTRARGGRKGRQNGAQGR